MNKKLFFILALALSFLAAMAGNPGFADESAIASAKVSVLKPDPSGAHTGGAADIVGLRRVLRRWKT